VREDADIDDRRRNKQRIGNTSPAAPNTSAMLVEFRQSLLVV
jgi:hypothetical protein